MKEQAQDEFGGYPEAERWTGLKRGTLYSKVARREIPHRRLGGRLVRFSKREIIEWLDRHRVPVEDGLEGGAA